MKTYKVVWTDYKHEKEYLIGILVHDKEYMFSYNKSQIKEAIENGFRPFIEFPNIEEVYFSRDLFKTFAIRLIDRDITKLEKSLDNNAQLSTDRIKIYSRTDVNEV